MFKKRVTYLLAVLFFFCAIKGEAAPKVIGIFTFPSEKLTWDPESVKTGITGSEEAVIYISQKLVLLGYKVVVFGNPPQGSLHSLPQANPRFLKFEPANLHKVDIAIAWRMPEIASALRKYADKVYLWPHDPCTAHFKEAEIQGFDDVLWLSKWQRHQWVAMSPAFARFKKIFGNGINPEQFKQLQQRGNPYACIYGSNYARGLEILLDLWPTVKQRFPLATLDIYYGWQHWGLLTPQKETKMRRQIAELVSLGVQEHGLVGHEELNRAYEKAAFWTYPCTDVETFCITALRAQLAGAIPVVIARAALKETVPFGYQCSNSQEYLATLCKALQHAEEISLEERKKMGEFVLDQFTWETIAMKWHHLFEGL
jgi:glycosyltransferase involved in cell wall biosynthesis